MKSLLLAVFARVRVANFLAPNYFFPFLSLFFFNMHFFFIGEDAGGELFFLRLSRYASILNKVVLETCARDVFFVSRRLGV